MTGSDETSLKENPGTGRRRGNLGVRLVEAEILDSLAADDPAALANRRDIRRINWIMGNFRWAARQLAALPGPHGMIELAGGDGALGLYLLGHDILNTRSPYALVDRAPRPPDWPVLWDWRQEDLRGYRFRPGQTTLLANLILHQLEDRELASLGDRIGRSGIRYILASEPARRRTGLFFMTLLGLLGMHRVTVHDGKVSIRAGFRRGELHRLLGLSQGDWNISYSQGLGAIRMIAIRK